MMALNRRKQYHISCGKCWARGQCSCDVWFTFATHRAATQVHWAQHVADTRLTAVIIFSSVWIASRWQTIVHENTILGLPKKWPNILWYFVHCKNVVIRILFQNMWTVPAKDAESQVQTKRRAAGAALRIAPHTYCRLSQAGPDTLWPFDDRRWRNSDKWNSGAGGVRFFMFHPAPAWGGDLPNSGATGRGLGGGSGGQLQAPPQDGCGRKAVAQDPGVQAGVGAGTARFPEGRLAGGGGADNTEPRGGPSQARRATSHFMRPKGVWLSLWISVPIFLWLFLVKKYRYPFSFRFIFVKNRWFLVYLF